MSYQSKVTVRYAETDRMSITHHSVYFIWFEEARSMWVKSSGLSYSEIEKRGIMMPIVDLSCHYYGTSDYMDELSIVTSMTKLTAAKICFEYIIYKENSLITKGASVHAWVDAKTFKPINIKKQAPDIYNLMYNALDKK
ncbi:MAG: acyl-CoA thioesterase [Oscillospiraceae bacterium]|nr:acyl-CoA thioesterase [Oscillospiraceae bacterium]